MENIDITITGGVLGITERRSAHPETLDGETRRSLEAAFGSESATPVPTTDHRVRDDRLVTIGMGAAETSFPEHLAPPFWIPLKTVACPSPITKGVIDTGGADASLIVP